MAGKILNIHVFTCPVLKEKILFTKNMINFMIFTVLPEDHLFMIIRQMDPDLVTGVL